MAGDTPNEDGSMPSGDENFLSHPWQGRALIAVAGPLANLITACLIMTTIGMVGVTYPDYPNLLGHLADSSSAFRAGLRDGDRIVAVDGAPVNSWISIFMAERDKPAKATLTFTAQRGESTFTIPVRSSERHAFLESLDRPASTPVVGTVVVGMPAYKAGVQEGDSILAVNGTPVNIWDDLPRAIGSQTDKPVVMRVQRHGQVFDLTVTPVDATGAGKAQRRTDRHRGAPARQLR
jgi:regulator of sigma E protease